MPLQVFAQNLDFIERFKLFSINFFIEILSLLIHITCKFSNIFTMKQYKSY
jgi:hypothetical protein